MISLRILFYSKKGAILSSCFLSDTPCVLLSGPRQSVKTTLIENWDKNTTYVTLDDLTTLNRAKIDPEGFINQLASEKKRSNIHLNFLYLLRGLLIWLDDLECFY